STATRGSRSAGTSTSPPTTPHRAASPSTRRSEPRSWPRAATSSRSKRAAPPLCPTTSRRCSSRRARAATGATRSPCGRRPSPTLNVSGASQLYEGALVEVDNGTAKEVVTVQSVSGDTVTFGANLANTYFEGHRARAIGVSVEVTYAPNGVVEADEVFGPLRL